MRKALKDKIAAAITVFLLLVVGGVAMAEEMKVVGDVVKIEIAPDGKSAMATLKDTKTGNLVTVTVIDDLTLDKFKDHRIVVGDEIRCKYEIRDGNPVSKYFRKTAGC